MKPETVLKHLEIIALREFAAWDYDYYFPDEKLLRFLAETAAGGQKIRIDSFSSRRTSSFYEWEIRLEILRRKDGPAFGFYEYERRTAKCFNRFFADWMSRYLPAVMEAEDGRRFDFLLHEPDIAFALIRDKIRKEAEDFAHPYDERPARIFAAAANSRKELKIIVQDAKDDYYICRCRIWALQVRRGNFWLIENVKRDCRRPDFINQAHFFFADRRIVQISEGEKLMFSCPAFAENELAGRRDFLKNELKKFTDLLR